MGDWAYTDLVMKKIILFAIGFLMCVSLIGSPSGLSWTCLAGSSRGNCTPGQVAFTGNGYTGTVHVNVMKNSNNAEYDDFDYDASGGTLSFTETLSPGGNYTITLTVSGTDITQTVGTGDVDN